MIGRVRANILCGECAAERRRAPAQLGTVRVLAGGAVAFYAEDQRLLRKLRKARGTRPRFPWRHGVALVAPAVSWYQPPDRLQVWCPVHGPGTVATATVTTASGRVITELVRPRRSAGNRD